MDADKNKNTWKMVQLAGLGFSIPFEIAAGPFIGYFIGVFLRDKFGVHRYFIYVFIVLGFIASISNTVMIITEMIRIQEGERDKTRK
ncbi:MAG: AtpZ/AtpI family protein [Candidatus Omnitrophica bacterium]|nr:AtpZ/AtpI family protein [Candidatus Omnitrophota bacterium]